MGLLVRNVIDFMTPEERSLPEVAGLIRYNARLAQIYRDEEPLAGMPINMEGFCLFAPNRRTSLPLCLAYEAVAAAWPELAERFLYRLRYATVVECRPTTIVEELTRTAVLCGMSADEFGVAYRSSDAQDRLYQDLALKEQLRIFGLPAFVVSCDRRGALLHGVPTYQQLERAIAEVSGNSVQAHKPSASTEALLALFARHPLISLNELAAAFDLADAHAAIPLVQPRIDAGEITFAPAPKGRFLCKKDAPQS